MDQYKFPVFSEPGYQSFQTPEAFLAAAAGYFNWCVDHPILEDQVFQYKGSIVRTSRKKVRVFTKKGLAAHLNVPASRLESYLQRDDEWKRAAEMVEQIIHNQKFENAAANMLNAGFIARDLGMADKQELTGAEGGPIQTEELSARERIAGKLAGLAARIDPPSDPVGADGDGA